MKKLVKVIGAIVENENNEILCALRSTKMSLPNLWEFPGGKIEKNETFKQAIEREIKEELSCTVEFIGVFHDTTFPKLGPSRYSSCKKAYIRKGIANYCYT